MPKKKPTQTEWVDAYKKGARAKAEKWRTNFLGTTGIADAAKSDVAQKSYEDKMTDLTVLKVRQKKLAKLSDVDFKGPVEKGTSAMYSSAVDVKADKAGKGVMPFIDKIWDVLPTLEAKTDDVDANIDNRVKPIARALRDLKRGGS